MGPGKVPGHILDAERAMKEAQEYRQALDSAVGPGNLSQSEVMERHAHIGRWDDAPCDLQCNEPAE